MGLPEVIIEFQTKSTTAVVRSSKGIVALILKDDTNKTFDTKIYKSISEINSTDWNAKNKEYIELVFMGTPSKVIVERIDSSATDYNTALARLKNKKWNYLSVPGIGSSDVTSIASWIKSCREVNKKTFKAVLPNCAGDHEGIINFTTENNFDGTNTFSASEYTARIAGILAGLPLSQSATYYTLPELVSITESEDPNADIDSGKLILINDGANIKIGRAINSLTTTTPIKGESFKKIKIVEGVDFVRDDIRDTFENYYVGKVINNYDNKVIFVNSINSYFKQIAKDNILDINNMNIAEIDIETQRIYLQSIGISVDSMTEQVIKEYNTDDNVFVSARVKFVDAMENLTFSVSM